MAEQDGKIVIPVIPELDTKGMKAPLNEIEKELQKHIGEPLDEAFAKIIDKEKRIGLTFAKAGKKVRAVLLQYDKDMKLVGRYRSKVSSPLTQKQASSLTDSISVDAYKDSLTQIEKQQRAREKNSQAKKIKQQKEQLKIEKENLKLEESIQRSARANQFLNLIGETMNPFEAKRIELKMLKNDLADLERQFMDFGDETSPEFDKLKRKISQTQSQINSLKKELEKEKKVSWIERLLNTFKRVGFYRVARRLFQLVEQGFSQSITAMAQFDSEVNDTMSSITSQFQIMSSSLMVMVYPLLQMVKPVLESITQGVASFANAISYLIAKLTGASTYLKVNTEYMKEFNQEANKFSFDKFESLSDSGEIDPTKMFERAEVADGMDGSMQGILDKVTAIGGALLAFESLKFFKWISGDGPLKFVDSLGKMNSKILDIGVSVGFLVSVYEVIKTIKDLIDNWDSKSLAEKIKGICKVALYGISGILLALSYIPALGISFKIGGLVALASAVTLDSIGVFANGGIAEQGDLFIANEAGPELVYSGPNNSSSIMNIAQFRQAVVEGLYEWWSDAKYDIPEPVVGGVDGASIASSRRFIDEFNRRNSGMKIR